VEEIQEVPERGVPGKERSALQRFFSDLFETLVLAAFLFLSINSVSTRIRVDGFSMEPTLHNDEYVLIDKISYRFQMPHRGDVIVFHFPRDPNQEYIKRIIGLPGDTVESHAGKVYVNGQAIREPYLVTTTGYQGRWKVSQDELFVLGDNRNNSSDSHSWGAVPVDYVVGKAFLVYWPPEQWSIIPHEAYGIEPQTATSQTAQRAGAP
jgi:signal peptidase I